MARPRREPTATETRAMRRMLPRSFDDERRRARRFTRRVSRRGAQFLVVKLAVKRWPGKLSLAVKTTPGMSRSKRKSKSGVTTCRPGSAGVPGLVGRLATLWKKMFLATICVAAFPGALRAFWITRRFSGVLVQAPPTVQEAAG